MFPQQRRTHCQWGAVSGCNSVGVKDQVSDYCCMLPSVGEGVNTKRKCLARESLGTLCLLVVIAISVNTGGSGGVGECVCVCVTEGESI